MAQPMEVTAVYAAGVIQGVVLVTFPAVSAIFTSPAHYGLSSKEYGDMFVPQAVTAILSSFLGASLNRLIGSKRVFQCGLAADFLSMAVLFLSQFETGSHLLAYSLLNVATGLLGIGFGLTVPAINTFSASFFPKTVDRAILTLNALLGLGTALAPVFAIVFVGFGFWWGLPVLMSALTLALLLFSFALNLDAESESRGEEKPQQSKLKLPFRFWVYAAFALLYGICETMNANWATVYMSSLGVSTALASMALTLFWVSVTGGRIVFAATEKWLPQTWTYCGLPVLLALAFLFVAFTPRADPILALLSFGLAGLGCSALLPLVISFGQKELTSISTAVAGGLIGFYQMGYGIAAFGVGLLQSREKINLATLYCVMPVLALLLAAFALGIAGPQSAGLKRSKI